MPVLSPSGPLPPETWLHFASVSQLARQSHRATPLQGCLRGTGGAICEADLAHFADGAASAICKACQGPSHEACCAVGVGGMAEAGERIEGERVCVRMCEARLPDRAKALPHISQTPCRTSHRHAASPPRAS